MKKLLLLLLSLPSIAIIMAYKPSTKVSFTQMDWDAARNKAISEKKIYFVDFDASYCATCRNMDQTTYQSVRLAEYIESNVVANRINIQDFDGVMWSQRYDVEALPTMLFFDEKGRLVKKMVGYKNAQQLMDIFKSIKTENVNVAPSSTPVLQDETPMAENNRPLYTPEAKVKNAKTKVIRTSTTDIQRLNPQGKGLFEINVEEQKSEGYSVQVGVYSTYENLLKGVSNLRKKFDKKTIIHLDEIGDKVVYKLLLGKFNSRHEANAFNNILRAKGIKSMVRDMSLLK